MILILSTPTDYDTNGVIDWLVYNKMPFFRLNDEDLMQGRARFYHNPEDLSQTYFEHFNQKIFLNDITVVWYRKFGFLIDYEKKIGVNNDLLDYIYTEFKNIYNLIMKLLEGKKTLCEKPSVFSKIDILNKASQIGLKVPKSLITTEKSRLIEFYSQNNSFIITKSIGEAKHLKYKNSEFTLATHMIKNVEMLPCNFSPSLFQQYIDKEIEIRVFYLDKKCYSMAIFSQNNENTKLDFRNYDNKHPNRFVPYKLPEIIEDKIVCFMESIGLNTGSLDIIKAKADGQYYFLEVNPFGQFGMTSKPCNYNLHKKVAEFLIKMRYD
ncbi:grasp-with-spasm system ATP-grasp peptide maturase [Flavobacterium sp. UW10123]|uniref:grasp-with-spasm system ATP-grasp peptide maturase n=1 Tax=Flavobacterium sp. UW10123 TaxID=3230800 RepID=UPI003390A1DD